MSDDVIRPGRLPGGQTFLGAAVPVGTVMIQAPHALVQASDAPGSTTLLLQHEDPADSRIGVLLYTQAADGSAHGYGLLTQFTPDEARGIAASLLRLAQRLDPVTPN